MKESIGLVATINIIMVFLIVSFVFIIGIVSYSKAFKAASLIVKSIERYEGYNEASFDEINKKLSTLAYERGDSSKCAPTKNATIGEGTLVKYNDDENFLYCIYKFDGDGDNKHYSYGIVTYMMVDFSMFNMKVKFPVYAKTSRIYRFTNS